MKLSVPPSSTPYLANTQSWAQFTNCQTRRHTRTIFISLGRHISHRSERFLRRKIRMKSDRSQLYDHISIGGEELVGLFMKNAQHIPSFSPYHPAALQKHHEPMQHRFQRRHLFNYPCT